MTTLNNMRLIETDSFGFEFLSQVAERESWRKEIHRPIYHVHKWWAKRLGSVFRGILLGSVLPEGSNLSTEFYKVHKHKSVIWDPFMGSGTTIGEAHKLGMTALGRDINPVAEQAVRVALGPLHLDSIHEAFRRLERTVGREIRAMYTSTDSLGRSADVLYWFWVMQASCPSCADKVDLFSSRVIARNAYPTRKPEVQLICPHCDTVFEGRDASSEATCPACTKTFAPSHGAARGATATCQHCGESFSIIDALDGKRPTYRLIAKLVLTEDGRKEYLVPHARDLDSYAHAEDELERLERDGAIDLPTLRLAEGFNTKQAMRYGFTCWRDFFNARQLLALSRLRTAITREEDSETRAALLTLFSGTLEFNNLFASYKGEGTGAVRHMFSHHILKPERTPIEANVWGTKKSSGAFATLFKSRLLRAIGYRMAPTEVGLHTDDQPVVSSPPMGGTIVEWPSNPRSLHDRAVALSCGDSARSGLPDSSIDLVVTDPPFFDNVHYSELADFFAAWRSDGRAMSQQTTRHAAEVQDSDATSFRDKLADVLAECRRVLRPDGLLVFTYHHSRTDGWNAVAEAVLQAGFVVVNAHPVKSEMSVATPKSQASDPIQLDIILVCRSARGTNGSFVPDREGAFAVARNKIARLASAGFSLSRNDQRVVIHGQLLSTARTSEDVVAIGKAVEMALSDGELAVRPQPARLPVAVGQ